MRVTNMVPDIQYQMQLSQQALATAEEQVATGLRVNQPSDDPTASAAMVLSLASSANVDQYTSNVSSVLPMMQTADSAISAIQTTLNSVVSLGTEGATGTATTQQRQEIATQVASDLSSVIAQANSNYQGMYVFGGSATTTPPFVAASETYTSSQGTLAKPLKATTPLTAGSVTTFYDASTGGTVTFTAKAGNTIATLAATIAKAVSAGTLPAGTNASINPSGQLAISTNSSSSGIVVSTNDAVLGSMTAAPGTQVGNAYVYVGNSSINHVQVGDSLSVATNVSGSQLFTTGANVVGTLTNLITALQSGTPAEIATATTAVSTAINYVGQQRVPLDNTINQLNDQESYLGQEKVTLTSAQSSLVDANLADAATDLSQAQLDNSAVLAAAGKIMPDTLLNYLSQG